MPLSNAQRIKGPRLQRWKATLVQILIIVVIITIKYSTEDAFSGITPSISKSVP